MKPEINTETVETVKTGGDQAVVQERIVRGCVDITWDEISHEGVKMAQLPTLLKVAARHGCPINAGYRIRDDYVYRVIHKPCGGVYIEWEWNPTVNANTTNAIVQTPPGSGTKDHE
jgi:hypothetical protein